MRQVALAAKHQKRDLECRMRNGPYALAVIATRLAVDAHVVRRIVESDVPVSRELPFRQNFTYRLREIMHPCGRYAKTWLRGFRRWLQRREVVAAHLQPLLLLKQREAAPHAIPYGKDLVETPARRICRGSESVELGLRVAERIIELAELQLAPRSFILQ